MFCERRHALEAAASSSHGPRLPLSETHCARVGCGLRASRGGGGAPCQQRCRSGSQQGCSWNRSPRSQGIDRKTAGCKEGQEGITMGQKTHPYGFRLGYNKPWKSRWYTGRDYAELLHEDVKLRKELKEKLKSAGISSIDIERAANKLVVRIFTARPGIIIGRKGAEIDKLKQDVQKPELDAQLVAESIALQLEKRVAFRRAMRKAVDSALRFGCKGIKV